MSGRPSCLPSREVLTGYLVALIPPSITTLDEQLHFLELDFKRAILEARIDVLESVQKVTPCIQYEAHLIELRAELAELNKSTAEVSGLPCRRAILGEDARTAFSPDIYDCARCGHMIGNHAGPNGECLDCLSEDDAATPGGGL